MKSAWLIVLSTLVLSSNAVAFEVIAHRGVHQTFPKENLDNDTCTASLIYPPSHALLENTLESIREAFRWGATTVEVDIHPTTEPHGKPHEMVVFHDWNLDCGPRPAARQAALVRITAA